MKSNGQPNWTIQLIGIILLFSIGLSLFPVGYLVNLYLTRLSTPSLAYAGRFQANLTVTTPMVSESLGVCSDIYISDWSADPSTVLFLHIRDDVRNETVIILPMSQSLNTSGVGWSDPLVHIDIMLPNSPYTVEVHRFTNDTYFECRIVAYNIYPMSPPSPITLYVFWFIGTLMLIAGVVALHRFNRRIKDLMWEDNTKKSVNAGS